MTRYGSIVRLIAVVLVVVLVGTVVAPARAEAMDPFTIMAIGGAVVCVVILIAYLIVANTKGRRMDQQDAGTPQPVMVACVEAEGQPRQCWAVDRPEQPLSEDQIQPVEQIQPVVAAPGFAAPQLVPQS